ncbi:hypothetical protein ABIC09_007362 [Bradyrhizobium sp. S3.12.5]
MKETASTDSVISPSDLVKRAARIGVEIRNIKLSGDLPNQTIAVINSLLLEHKVIFFRDQGHLDDAEQERFAACLGRLVPHPTLGTINGTTSIIELDSARGPEKDSGRLIGSRVSVACRKRSRSAFVRYLRTPFELKRLTSAGGELRMLFAPRVFP